MDNVMVRSLRGLGDDPTCVTGSIDASSGDTLVCPETVGSSGNLQFYTYPGGQATANPLTAVGAPSVSGASWGTLVAVLIGLVVVSGSGGGRRR